MIVCAIKNSSVQVKDLIAYNKLESNFLVLLAVVGGTPSCKWLAEVHNVTFCHMLSQHYLQLKSCKQY